MPLGEFRNAFEYIEQLKAQNPKDKHSFETLKKYLSAKATKQGIPTNGTFELTPLCNFNCGMCYTHLSKEQLNGRHLLTTDQWKGLMYDAWKAGMMYANLTGGECLTYPGFEELYLYLRSLGVMVTVLSNGALMDERWIRFFKDHKPAQIQITLYGGDEDTYERVTGRRDFTVVTEAICRIIAAAIPLKIVVTPSRYMGEGVFKAIRTAASFGVPYGVNAMLFDPFTIEWDGIMHPCSSIRHIQANALEAGFQTAWDDIRLQCQKWPNIPECKDCPYHAVCTPCPSMKAQFAEPGKQPLALCERTKYLVECGVKDLPECE